MGTKGQSLVENDAEEFGLGLEGDVILVEGKRGAVL